MKLSLHKDLDRLKPNVTKAGGLRLERVGELMSSRSDEDKLSSAAAEPYQHRS